VFGEHLEKQTQCEKGQPRESSIHRPGVEIERISAGAPWQVGPASSLCDGARDTLRFARNERPRQVPDTGTPVISRAHGDCSTRTLVVDSNQFLCSEFLPLEPLNLGAERIYDQQLSAEPQNGPQSGAGLAHRPKWSKQASVSSHLVCG
jgi:hypothetical protein